MKATVYTVLSVPDNSKFQSQGTNEPIYTGFKLQFSPDPGSGSQLSKRWSPGS